MFELAVIKKIYYKKQKTIETQLQKDIILLDLFFRGRLWLGIKLYQFLGFQIKPIINQECLLVFDEKNINEGQMIAFYLGDVEKSKILINQINVLNELSKFIQVEIDIVNIIKASNSANISALNAQIVINNQISSSLPATSGVINAQNPNIINSVNAITLQNTNLDTKKQLLQNIKESIDKTFFLEYE